MEQANPRVLMVSHRLLEPHVSLANAYEFEDVVCAIDDVDLVAIQAVEPSPLPGEKQVLWRIRKRTGVQIERTPRRRKFEVTKNYDLLFVRVMSSRQLDILDSVQGWQENCRNKVCWIEDLWPKGIKHWVRQLEQFDHIFVGLAPTVEPLSKAIDRPCSFLPPGVDALRFCPYPNPPSRCIDFYTMGRRSPVTHQSLLSYAKQRGDFTYLYDSATPRNFVEGPAEHRELTASLIKRSRYFMADRAKANEPEQTGGAQAFGSRFFEGAAAGAVLIGAPPESPTFDAYFGWPDAQVPLEYGSTDIGEVIEELDADPDRLHRARRANITNVLRRHDCVYRWQTALAELGLSSQQAATERRTALELRAREVEKHSS